ncbi:hypothetical protein D9758_002866 [Tetrapyrgos nigripes]|uniref:Transcription factor domain-containing protein n=1 Tax=Tetrapyrgos nigripes TaxID=182062 RepID=A0A8H5LTN1_9AGAR|nr:hypothetical protein D9758_002866 [Tetrapyrgos nigripes]
MITILSLLKPEHLLNSLNVTSSAFPVLYVSVLNPALPVHGDRSPSILQTTTSILKCTVKDNGSSSYLRVQWSHLPKLHHNLRGLPPVVHVHASPAEKESWFKCDRQNPCERCTESGHPEECEYTADTPMQRLEEHVTALQAKLAFLESSKQQSTKRARTQKRTHARSSPSSAGSSSGRSDTADTSSSTSMSGPSGWQRTDLPPEVFKTLMDAFVLHARTFGFFLHHRPYFMQALLYTQTPSEVSISPLLRHSVYLLGLHLCPSLRQYESVFLQNVLRPDFTAVQIQYTVQNIQAEVLLIHYFLRQGSFAEAQRRLNSAQSFMVTYGLHKMGQDQNIHDPLFGDATSNSGQVSRSSLPPPVDSIEYGERLCAFWTVVHLYKFWTSQSELSQLLDEKITTPFPLGMSVYEQNLPSIDSPCHLTLKVFFNAPIMDASDSLLTLTVKASVLFERAIYWSLNSEEDIRGFYQFKTNLFEFIRAFMSQSRFRPQYSKQDFEVLKIHTMIHVAVINFWRNRSDREAKMDSVNAAQAAANGLRNTPNPYDEGHIDPMFGPLWSSVCNVLFSSVTDMESLLPISNEETLSHYSNLKGLAGDVLRAMRVYSPTCSVINSQLQEIESRWLQFTSVEVT